MLLKLVSARLAPHPRRNATPMHTFQSAASCISCSAPSIALQRPSATREDRSALVGAACAIWREFRDQGLGRWLREREWGGQKKG